MKRVYSLLSVLLLGVSMVSCKKFLNTTPEDFLSPKNYYETEAQLNYALNGVYATLKSSSMYGNYMLGRMGLEADEGFNFATNELATVGGYNVSANDIKIEAFWKELYTGISKANLLLANIQKPEMDEAKRTVIAGETLFLRAYFYFMLVQHFGDVPLVLTPTESASASGTQLPRTPAKQVYEQILADMEQAAAAVGDIQQVGHGGKISKSAVWGILARVNLAMAGYPLNEKEHFADAKAWAQKVIETGAHELNKSYEAVFINYASDVYDYKESIWEVEFWGNNSSGPYLSGGMVGRGNGIRYSSGDPAIGYAVGYTHPSIFLYNLYEDPGKLYSYDLRRDWSIAPFRYSNTNPATKIPYAVTEISQRCVGKFRREYETLLPKVDGYTSINFPLLRYADVLLMYAEADNEINGPTSQAIAYVNEVRKRGYGKLLNGRNVNAQSIKTVLLTEGGSNYTSAPVVTISGGEGRDATATATVSGGKVTAVTLTNPGHQFKTTPAISFAGGDGSGVVATAVLTTDSDALLPDEAVADLFAFRDVIQKERARELSFELLRKADLVRWGLFTERMDHCKQLTLTAPAFSDRNNALIYFSNASDRDRLWPIPAHDMGVNPELVQNPGW